MKKPSSSAQPPVFYPPFVIMLEMVISELKKQDKDQLINKILQDQGVINQFNHELTQKNDDIQKLQESIEALQQELIFLKESILDHQRALYGKKSEKTSPDDDQLGLFIVPTEKQEEPSASETDSESEEETEQITYTRKKRGKQQKDLSLLPKKTTIIPVSEEDLYCCGMEKHLIRYEIRYYLNIVRPRYEVIEEKREVRACSNSCEGSMVTALAPDKILPKSYATEDLLADIAVSKCIDRKPYYLQAQNIKSQYGFEIPDSTMARWMIQLYEPLKPLLKRIEQHIFSYDVIWIDETPLQVLKEPDRKPETKSNVLAVKGGPPGQSAAVLKYIMKEPGKYIKNYLQSYAGYVHCDALQAHQQFKESKTIKLAFCNTHNRRYYEKVTKTTKKPGIAKSIMNLYTLIYKQEKIAKQQDSPEERKEYRLKHILPLFDEMKSIIDSKAHLRTFDTKIGHAIDYSLNHWPKLMTWQEDGRIELDNNLAEQLIKKFVMPRKMFLFSGTVSGAEALCLHFSILLTAQMHSLDLRRYYSAVMKKIPFCKTNDDYDDLLPWNIQIPDD